MHDRVDKFVSNIRVYDQIAQTMAAGFRLFKLGQHLYGIKFST